MIRLLKRLWSDKFWRNNAIFLTSTLFVAFLNYLYYPLLGRFMDFSAFGELQVLLAIFNIVAMVLNAIQIVIVNITVNKKSSVAIINQFERITLLAIATATLVFIVMAGHIQRFYQFSSVTPFYVLGLLNILSVTYTFKRAYLQGKGRFWELSIGSIVMAICKLVVSVVLVLASFGAFGAMAGIAVAQIIALLYVHYEARRRGLIAAHTKFKIDLQLLRPELRFLGAVMVVFLLVTLLYTGDVLVVKRLFSPEATGQYAGIATVAKIVFLGTASFSAVLLSTIGTKFSPRHNYAALRKSLLLIVLSGGAVLVLFTLFPEFSITMLIGSRYEGYASLLPLMTLANLVVAVVNLFFYYFLALRRYIIVPIAVCGGVVTLMLVQFRHASLSAIVENFLIGGSVTLCMLIVLEAWSRLKMVKESAV